MKIKRKRKVSKEGRGRRGKRTGRENNKEEREGEKEGGGAM